MIKTLQKTDTSARQRVLVAAVIALVVAAAIGLKGNWAIVPLAFWDTAAAVYLVWTWLVIWPMDEQLTAQHASREDPTRAGSDVVLLAASVASLATVGYVLVQASSSSGLAKGLLRWGRYPERYSVVGLGAHHLHLALCPAFLHRSDWRGRLQRARPAVLRRFCLPLPHPRHDLPSVRHRPQHPGLPQDGFAPRPVVVSVRHYHCRHDNQSYRRLGQVTSVAFITYRHPLICYDVSARS